MAYSLVGSIDNNHLHSVVTPLDTPSTGGIFEVKPGTGKSRIRGGQDGRNSSLQSRNAHRQTANRIVPPAIRRRVAGRAERNTSVKTAVMSKKEAG